MFNCCFLLNKSDIYGTFVIFIVIFYLLFYEKIKERFKIWDEF